MAKKLFYRYRTPGNIPHDDEDYQKLMDGLQMMDDKKKKKTLIKVRICELLLIYLSNTCSRTSLIIKFKSLKLIAIAFVVNFFL